MDLQTVNGELKHKINKYDISNQRSSSFNSLIQQKKFNNEITNTANNSASNPKYDQDFDEEITYDSNLDIFRVNFLLQEQERLASEIFYIPIVLSFIY